MQTQQIESELVNSIKRKIIFSEIIAPKKSAGQPISTIRDISQKLGYSHTAVQRAVRALILEDILTTEDRKGCFIKNIQIINKTYKKLGQLVVIIPTFALQSLTLLYSIECETSINNLSTTVITAGWKDAILSEYYKEKVRDDTVIGVIIYHPQSSYDSESISFFNSIKNRNIPVVLIDTFWKDFPVIQSDFEKNLSLAQSINSTDTGNNMTIVNILFRNKAAVINNMYAESTQNAKKNTNGGDDFPYVFERHYERRNDEWMQELHDTITEYNIQTLFFIVTERASEFHHFIKEKKNGQPKLCIIGSAAGIPNNKHDAMMKKTHSENIYKKNIIVLDELFDKRGGLAIPYIVERLKGKPNSLDTAPLKIVSKIFEPDNPKLY
jgi:DNA-binding transcriptional regulator YhcF (GntR family)